MVPVYISSYGFGHMSKYSQLNYAYKYDLATDELEKFVNGVPLVLVERDGVLEDTHHINRLKAENLCVSIKE